MDDLMKGLRAKYLSTIREINPEDIESVLPSSAYSNFFPLMKGILEELSTEVTEWQNTASECQNKQDKDECKREASLAERKLIICENYYRQNLTIENAKESNESNPSNPYNLVFGINPAGNISAKKDLERDVDEHYYEQILELIADLEQGTNIGNVEKRKKLSTTIERFKGLSEIKGFQVRIMYRELPNNILYIEMIRIKKDDWSLKDRKDVETRDVLLSKDFNRIKQRIRNNDHVEDLIIENQKILAEIKDYIEKSLAGRKKANG